MRLAGTLQIGLAILHLFFPKWFHWKEELARLSLLNRQIFVVHTVFICVVLGSMGALSLFAPAALLQPSQLSRLILGGFAFFWGLRLVFQWLVYDARLWRGSPWKTLAHIAFTALSIYLAAVYVAVLRS